MEPDGSGVRWWQSDMRAAASFIAGAISSVTRADLVFAGIFAGYLLVLWGLALFVWPAAPTISLFLIFPAVKLLIWPDSAVHAVEKRMAEGDDRHFEEQRSYRAYPIGTARNVRRRAALGVVLCLILAPIEVYRYQSHHDGRQARDALVLVEQPADALPTAPVSMPLQESELGQTRAP